MIRTWIGKIIILMRIFFDWFKRNRKATSIIGYMILLVTFVAREGVRDSLKDQLAGVDTAIVESMTLYQMSIINNENGRIQEALSTVQKAVKTEDIDKNPLHNSTGTMLRAAGTLNFLPVSTLTTMQWLSERIEFDDATVRDLKIFASDIDQFIRQNGELAHRNRMGEAVAESELSDLGQKADGLANNAMILQRNTLDIANRKRKTIETELSRVTMASYVLYGLGALLNFISLITGRGQLSSES